MCGIAGFAGCNDRSGAEQAVRRMVSALARRGPDGEGVTVWPEAVLGHRRLSIFDLSDAGRQPMCTADRSAAIVFNGAIYNFRELRAELENAGRSFHSQTDTEVLLNGYLQWGIEGLVARIRGMYAFGVWDNRSRKLYLVRDRLGVKPLVYTVREGSIAFASTIRALKQSGCVDGSIDPQAIAEYLEFGFITDARAVYHGAAKLPPASILEWADGKVRIWEYWRPPVAGDRPISFEDAVQETEDRFLEAVRLRLDADVPVGALLSGGVDSSLVCWAIAKLGGNIRAFTVATPGDPADESADAIETARILKLDHHVIPLSPADSPGIDELVAAYPEPFACSSALGMLRLSRVIKPAATVLLTGDGGDDVFLGYPEHRHFFAAQRLARRLPAAASSGWRAVRPLIPRRRILRRAAHFLDFAIGGLGAATQARDGFPYYERKHLLGERLLDARIAQREIPWSEDLGANLLTEFLEYDRRQRFTGEYLPKVDGGAMHHALEARSPFLDQDLWSFAASLPYSVRLHKGVLKAILREIARRRVSPRVATGPKRGFTIPAQQWIAGRWNAQAREAFQDSVLAREGWVRREAVLRELKTTEATAQAPLQLWYLYVLEMWMRREPGSAANDCTAALTSAT
jgi:asparagine synthase (glutamine-hydrolysing)